MRQGQAHHRRRQFVGGLLGVKFNAYYLFMHLGM
jgi:hypothetical protein